MIVYFDTVRRMRPVKEGGELVKLDWLTKAVIKAVPIIPTDPDIEDDPNPRGNSRGGKGILIVGDELFVGTYHSILVFDLDLKLKRKIDNHLFVNIHEMYSNDECMWVSSTAIDAAVGIDPWGRTLKTWWPREQPILRERFSLSPMEIDKTADNRLRYLFAELSTKEHHTHLNSVVCSEGATYALLNRMGAFVQLEPETRVVLCDDDLKGGHSPAFSTDGKSLLVCSSFRKSVLVYSVPDFTLTRRIYLPDFAEISSLSTRYPDRPFNQSIFVRGLCPIDSDRLLVGISPASILEIDYRRGELLDFYQYSTEVSDAVHGLAIPREYSS